MNNSLTLASSLRSPFALLAVTFVLGVSGCTLSMEADVADVEVTEHDISIVGVPRTAFGGDVSTHISFTQTLPTLDLPKGLDSHVEAATIEFTAKSGIEDLAFVRTLRITMTPNGSPAPIELINYEKADGAVVGKTLRVDSLNAVNLLKDWKDEALFDIQVAGTLPEQAWKVDLSVHFNGKFSYKY